MTIGATLLQVGGGVGVSVPGLILHATFFSKIVLALLLGISVYSWAVIWMRSRLLASAERADRKFLQAGTRTPIPLTDSLIPILRPTKSNPQNPWRTECSPGASTST